VKANSEKHLKFGKLINTPPKAHIAYTAQFIMVTKLGLNCIKNGKYKKNKNY